MGEPGKYDVCMLLENSFKNDARVLKEARSLARQGLKTKLLALRDPGTAAVEEVFGFRVIRLAVRSRALRGRWALGLKAVEFVGRLLWSTVFHRAEAYHAHHPMCLLPAVMAAKLRRSKVVYDMHELHVGLTDQTPWGRMLVTWYERALLRFVDLLIMSDGASRTKVFRSVHNYHKPIHYIYNCAATPEASASPKDLRGELGIPATHQIVVYTGFIATHRGLEQTIESMSQWPSGSHFVMIGHRTEAEEERLLALARRRGATGRVHLWGPVPPDDVALWARCADVAVVLIQPISSSYRNSAPTKMFEAIMAGVPQVASDFPEIRRVVQNNPVGPVGEVVDPTDTGAIAAAVGRIMKHQPSRETYRRNADVLARTVYNWEVQGQALIDLYAETLGIRSGGKRVD